MALTVRLPPGVVEDIDDVRGGASRSTWVRAAVAAAIREGLVVEPAGPPD